MPYTFYVLCTVLFSIHFLYCQIACTSLFSSSLTIMVCRHFFLKWWDFPVPSKIGKKTCHVAFQTNAQTFSVSFPYFSDCTYAVIMRATTGMIHNDIKNVCNLTHKWTWEFEAGRWRKQEQTSLTALFITSHRKPQEVLKSSFACGVVSILIYTV